MVGSASLTALLKRELAGTAPVDIQVAANADGAGSLPDGLVERVRVDAEHGGAVPGCVRVTVAGGQVAELNAVGFDLDLPPTIALPASPPAS